MAKNEALGGPDAIDVDEEAGELGPQAAARFYFPRGADRGAARVAATYGRAFRTVLRAGPNCPRPSAWRPLAQDKNDKTEGYWRIGRRRQSV
jgi:hypothetical protein